MDKNTLATFLVLATPLVAVIGGFTVAIIRIRSQQRLTELLQRERIAAIERGLDLSQLTLPSMSALTPRQVALRKAQGLFIGGLVCIALGSGLSLTLALLPDAEARTAWPIGLVPVFIGAALMISSKVVRRSAVEEP